jgi:hypothetical protein
MIQGYVPYKNLMNDLNIGNRKLFESDRFPRTFLGNIITIGRTFSFINSD